MKIIPARKSLETLIAFMKPSPQAKLQKRNSLTARLLRLFPCASVRGNAGFLDERPPQLDLRRQHLRVRFRHGALLAQRRRSELCEAIDHVLVLERALKRRGQLCDDCLVGARGSIEAVPDAQLEIAQPG